MQITLIPESAAYKKKFHKYKNNFFSILHKLSQPMINDSALKLDCPH